MAKNRDFSKFPNAITVLDNGNVGIGTSTPGYRLDITTSASSAVFSATSTNAWASGYLDHSGFFAPNMTGGALSVSFGKSSSTYNVGKIVFNYAGSGSSLNSLGFGFYDADNKLVIRANGNVGIGTTTPSANLSVKGSGDGVISLVGANNTFKAEMQVEAAGQFTGSLVAIPSGGSAYGGIPTSAVGITTSSTPLIFATNATEKMRLENDGTLKLGTYHSSAKFLPGADSNHYLRYNTSLDGLELSGYSSVMFSTLGGTERMRIDTYGRVTRPDQPTFLAYNSSGFTVTGGNWYNISNAITNETYDVGSCYNTSNGRFTAPTAGRYIFYAGGWSSIGSNGERYAFCARVNGGALFYIGGGNYCSVDSPLSGYSIVHNLAANDYVDLWVFSAVTGNWGTGSHGVYWGGYLL